MKRIALLMLASAMVAGAVDGRTETSARTTKTETAMTSARSVSLQSANLFLLDDLQDAKRTSELAEADLNALHAIADWINSFVINPHKDFGRAGPEFRLMRRMG